MPPREVTEELALGRPRMPILAGKRLPQLMRPARSGIHRALPSASYLFANFSETLNDHPSRSWEVYCSPNRSKAPMIIRNDHGHANKIEY